MSVGKIEKYSSSGYKYIEEGERLYEEAIKEFQRAKEGNNEVWARDACAKAWLAVIKASEALFVKKGVKEEELPKGYRGQKYFLRRHGDRELRRNFDSMRNFFHVEGYYEGTIDFEEVPEYLDDVKGYIERIKDLSEK